MHAPKSKGNKAHSHLTQEPFQVGAVCGDGQILIYLETGVVGLRLRGKKKVKYSMRLVSRPKIKSTSNNCGQTPIRHNKAGRYGSKPGNVNWKGREELCTWLDESS